MEVVMAVLINPFTDFGFKRIFGREDSKDILIGFLNALFEGEMKVVDLVYRDKERHGEFARDRLIIYDIYCTGEDGKEFIVEMQNDSQVHFEDRALYYASGAIVAQARRGTDWRYDLCPVIGIYFMNFSSGTLPGRFRSDFVLREIRTGEMLSDRLRIVFLQMKRFDKAESQCTSDLDKWTYIMNHIKTLENIPWKAQNELFAKLEAMSKIAAMTDDERIEYEASLRQYRDNNAKLDSAIQKGLEIGREEGREEEAKRIARALLGKGADLDLISECTGLSLDEIRGLQ